MHCSPLPATCWHYSCCYWKRCTVWRHQFSRSQINAAGLLKNYHSQVLTCCFPNDSVIIAVILLWHVQICSAKMPIAAIFNYCHCVSMTTNHPCFCFVLLSVWVIYKSAKNGRHVIMMWRCIMKAGLHLHSCSHWSTTLNYTTLFGNLWLQALFFYAQAAHNITILQWLTVVSFYTCWVITVEIHHHQFLLCLWWPTMKCFF